jgi:hypothetical protein
LIRDAQRNKNSKNDHDCSMKEKEERKTAKVVMVFALQLGKKRRDMRRTVSREGDGFDRAVAPPRWETQTPYRSRSTDPAGAVVYLPALPPLASLRTVFHSMSDLSSAWMEADRLRAFFRTSRVLA